MGQSPLMKMQAARLDEVLARLDLSAETAGLVSGCKDTAAAFLVLEQKGLLLEATKWAAHALPRREAVWWACMCIRHTAPKEQTQAERELVVAAELWVRKPSDENRRAAFALGQKVGFTSAEALIAMAVFLSGESLSPLDQPAVPPPADAAGRAVAGVVALAAVRGRPERHAARLARFLDSASDIANGGPGHLGPEDA
jgi:hypothetical protein